LSGNPPAALIGPDHQLNSALSRPEVATAARPTMPSFTAIHRVLVMSWFQASRYVPASSSRATSGPPQKAPMIAGSTSRMAIPAKNSAG
jgi:hypothetical protein